MIRVFNTYFLVFLMLWPVWRTGLVWAWFKVNQTYIAQELCINRDKPELSCSGKCILSLTLKANSKAGDPQFANGLEELLSKTFSFDYQPFTFQINPIKLPLPIQTTACFAYLKVPFSNFNHSVFRPPIAWLDSFRWSSLFVQGV